MPNCMENPIQAQLDLSPVGGAVFSLVTVVFVCLGFRKKANTDLFLQHRYYISAKVLFAKQSITLETALKATYILFDFNYLLIYCKSERDVFCS